nr:hypothetical protein CFP56_70075 [Quercus suber]
MDSTTIAPSDQVAMAQQIQALTANVQELMKQNEDLKNTRKELDEVKNAIKEKTPPMSMTDLLFKEQKYMNGEDALTAKGLMGKQKKEESAESQGKKRDRKDNLTEAKASTSGLEASSKKKLNFIPLLMPVDKILMQIKDNPALKWPKPLSLSSKWRDIKKYYSFHKDHGHYTDEYRDLKEQIEELIQRGKLQKFVKKEY